MSSGDEPAKIPDDAAAPAGDAAKPAEESEGWLSTIKHEIEAVEDTIENVAEEVATQPPSVLFLDVVKFDLPYIVMLSLALAAVGYVSVTGEPVPLLWEELALIYAGFCIWAGWRHAPDRSSRIRLGWTQALHWLACLVAMNIVYLGPVRTVANNNAASLALMTILALSTFLAGVHAAAWQICVVGALLALAVPAMALIQTSSLFVLIAIVGLIFIAATLWLTMHSERRKATESA
jgi:hypothetical protein